MHSRLLFTASILVPLLAGLELGFAQSKGPSVSSIVLSSGPGQGGTIFESIDFGELSADEVELLQGSGIELRKAPGAQEAKGEGGEEEERKIDAELLKKLGQSNFDRRPSVILATWSKPEPLAPEDDPELVLPEEPPGEDTLIQPPAVNKAFGKAPIMPWSYARWVAARSQYKKGFDALKEKYAADKKAAKEAKKEYDKKKKEIEGKRLARKVEIFQRHVTLGRWDQLAPFFDAVGEKGARQVYDNILRRLTKIPQQGSSNLRKHWEKHTFSFEDILALVEIIPDEIKKEDYAALTPLLGYCLEQGHDLEEGLERFRMEVARPEEERRLTKRQAALLLTHQKLERGDGRVPADHRRSDRRRRPRRTQPVRTLCRGQIQQGKRLRFARRGLDGHPGRARARRSGG